MRKIFKEIMSLFKHDCEDHARLTSSGMIKCNTTGAVFKTEESFQCHKCDKRWKNDHNGAEMYREHKKNPPTEGVVNSAWLN